MTAVIYLAAGVAGQHGIFRILGVGGTTEAFLFLLIDAASFCFWQAFAGWPVSAISVGEVLYVLWWLWRQRRGRERAGAQLGAKSRALIASLVDALRERAQPRRRLQPDGAW